MSDKYFYWDDEDHQRDWPYKLNRLRKYLETSCKQYNITVQALLNEIEEYRKRNLPGAVKQEEDELSQYESWKLDEIEQDRKKMYREALAAQSYLLNELGLNLPPDQRVENTELEHELKIENHQIVLVTDSEKEERIEAMAKELEGELPGEQAYISSEMQKSANNYVAPEDRALHDKLEAEYQKWLKKQHGESGSANRK